MRCQTALPLALGPMLLLTTHGRLGLLPSVLPSRGAPGRSQARQLAGQPPAVTTFNTARLWEPPSVAVMIAQVPGGPTGAVVMLNVPR
jgi:hypothetical protein